MRQPSPRMWVPQRTQEEPQLAQMRAAPPDWPISGAGSDAERMDGEGGMGNAKGGAFQPGILGCPT